MSGQNQIGKHISHQIYNKQLLTKDVTVSFMDVSKTPIEAILANYIKNNYEKRCITDGYVKGDSVSIVNYNAPIMTADRLKFSVMFECLVCNPVEGVTIKCAVKNITKAGIRAEVNTDDETPIVVFIARDHNNKNTFFSSITEQDVIIVKIIGRRFELNDTFISVIGELVETTGTKSRISILDDDIENTGDVVDGSISLGAA